MELKKRCKINTQKKKVANKDKKPKRKGEKVKPEFADNEIESAETEENIYIYIVVVAWLRRILHRQQKKELKIEREEIKQ